MVKSLYSGVSGLKTHQQKMDVIGNNIANVNTTGYKASVVTFADIYYQTKRTPSGATATLGGVNPRQVGYGVKMNTTTNNMTQSGYTYSDRIYDMALDGEGFFQLMDGEGNLFYTRAGVFNIDEQGYLVDSNGFHVLGISGDSEGQNAGSEIIRAVIPSTEANCSSATKTVNGVNVTISASAPSDNTDISVTFTESQYPYATYSGGILNIFFNSDEQYASEDAFEKAIAEAISAGGVELPDGVELKFDFESIPNDTEAAAASNSITGLKYSTTKDTANIYHSYTVTDAVTGDKKTKYAYVNFAADDIYETKQSVTFSYSSGATASVSYAGNVWTIVIGDTTTASDLNDLIEKYIADNSTDTNPIPALTCTGFVVPTDTAARAEAFATAQTVKLQGGRDLQAGFDIAVQEEGEFGNNYKVTFAYSSGYQKTKAVWDENNLTITVGNDTTIEDINNAIKEAAGGNAKKMITVSNVTGLKKNASDTTTAYVMNAAEREAFFGANPALSPADGKDSFFTKTAKSLSTFNLMDGRTGSEQSYKDLENVTVQSDGTIIGYHAVHGYLTLGRIDIATFENPNGLSAVGGTMFVETVASGEAQVNIAGTSGAGSIVAGALEMSNVDLSQEFTDMITTQRGYQANSRVITTSDTMLEELLSLKR
ncbi:MAG: flagellar hook-basal body complex protein [Oscillospiraceae bacterium]